MPLPNPNPVEIPATEAKSYPDLWLYNIAVHAPTVDSGMIRIESLPCNVSEGTIANGDHMVPIQTGQLWQAVAEVPEVQAAMEAILVAVEPLRAWIAAQEPAAQQPEPEPEPEADPHFSTEPSDLEEPEPQPAE